MNDSTRTPPTLQVVGSTTSRPSRDELDRLVYILRTFNQPLPKKWTPETIAQARARAQLLEVLL